MQAYRVRQMIVLVVVAAGLGARAWTEDRPQWGERYSRNMVSSETGLPAAFNPATGEHVRWSVSLGSNAYGTPVVAQGKVLIGANNLEPRDPRHQGDRGVLLCLNEADGALEWQLVVPRIPGDKYKDWLMIAMSSPPTIEGDRAYTVTNRFELVCLDLHGMANGNDGPYQDEARHMAPADEAPIEPGALDADILWLLDMVADVGMYPHDAAHVSVLLDGPYLYLNTGNGVDNTHAVIREPEAPSLIAVDKATGRLVAKDVEGIGPRIFHATWSSPALAEVAGRRLVFFGGADGVCYAFEALAPAVPEAVQPLKRAWRFDCDPAAPKEDVHEYLKNQHEGPSILAGMPVFHNNRIYLTGGGDIWWGKEEAWLKCIDATQSGDITETGAVWSTPLGQHACTTPAIVNGLVFAGDCAGVFHCVDAETGEPYWTHQLGKEIWGSALAADGKVYVASMGGDFHIFAAEKEKRELFVLELGASISSTPVAANGTLYVSTLERLYAIR